MIKVVKPEQAPKKLLEKGKKKRLTNCNSYERNKAAYDEGEINFEFDSKI